LFKFLRKSNSSSPILEDPDLDTLEPLIIKYRDNFLNRFDFSKPPEWYKYKKAIDDVIIRNFDSISFFMNNKIYKNKKSNQEKLLENVKTASMYATSCGWMIGYDCCIRDGLLKSRLASRVNIQKGDIPKDAMNLLQIAAYNPYWIFATMFIQYYESSYASLVRSQKDFHLRDTYNGILTGVMMCFLYGAQAS